MALPDGFASASHPCWSPDGRWIAFAAFDANGRDPLIRIAPAKGGLSTAVAAGSTPTWSSDGTRIAYVASGRADYATDWSSLGRNEERIEAVTLSGPRAGEVEVLTRGIWPRWSPIDDRLAFVGRADANWDIYVRSPDGLGLGRLTDDPALDTEPVWTSDGKSVVFLSDRWNRWDLYRVSADGRGGANRMTNHARREDHPSLSPDGRRVAFVDHRSRPDGSILILDLERGTVLPFPELLRRRPGPRLVTRRGLDRLHQPEARPAASLGRPALTGFEPGFQISDLESEIRDRADASRNPLYFFRFASSGWLATGVLSEFELMKQVRACGLVGLPSAVGTIRRFRRTVLSGRPGSLRVIANEQSRSALSVSTSIGSSEILPSTDRGWFLVWNLIVSNRQAACPGLISISPPSGERPSSRRLSLTFCLTEAGSAANLRGVGPDQRGHERQSGHP